MSRLMSVAYTEDAVVERRKTVTRRKGWWLDKRGRHLVKPGDHLDLCRKVMGRKKGEPLVRITAVEVVDVRREPLGLLSGHADPVRRGLPVDYAEREVAAEGFPGMRPSLFVSRYFVHAQDILPTHDVTRIEWRYLDKTWGGLVVGGPEHCAYCAAYPSLPCALHREETR